MGAFHYQSSLSWENLHQDAAFWQQLSDHLLPEYLYQCRWFGGKASVIQKVYLNELVPLQEGDHTFYLLLLEVFFQESYAHNYFLPLAISSSEQEFPKQACLGTLSFGEQEYQLVDAVFEQSFHQALYRRLLAQDLLKHQANRIFFRSSQELEQQGAFNSKLLAAEQSNSTIILKDRYFLKIFRRLFRDKNPDFEMNEYLAQQQKFQHFPKLAGLIWWEPNPGLNISLGLMQEKVENEGEAWTWMLKEVQNYFDQSQGKTIELEKMPLIQPIKRKHLPEDLKENPGLPFFKRIRTLAQRTAEMHLALASEKRDRNFAPINYNGDFTVWLKNRLIYQFDARYNLLNKKLESLPAEAKALAQKVIDRKDLIINFILGFDEEQLRSLRIRIHGDYHLGQILIQGDDFYILDYEGEPESTIRDRKVKQSPLKDVAGLLRSFHYAIHAVQKDPKNQDLDLHCAGQRLYQYLSGSFLNTYFKIAFREQLDIGYRKEINYLLHYFLLEKAIYELGYELNGRPNWAIIPLEGIIDITNEIQDYGD